MTSFLCEYAALLVSNPSIPVAVDGMWRNVWRRFICIVGRVIAIPSHTVPYSAFCPFVAYYSCHCLFFLAFLLGFRRLAFVTCPSVLVGDLVVVFIVHLGYLCFMVDGNCVFDSVLPTFNVLRAYAEDMVVSQSSWLELCMYPMARLSAGEVAIGGCSIHTKSIHAKVCLHRTRLSWRTL